MNIPEYFYLRRDESNPDQDKASVMEDNEIFTKNSLIVQIEYSSTSRKYVHYRSIAEYIARFNADKQHLTHEVILPFVARKPMFDIDGGTAQEHFNVLEMIEATFYDQYNFQPNIAIIQSVNTNPNETKLSSHIIITNAAFENSTEAKYFTEMLLRPNLTSSETKIVDNINKTTQHFRLPLTTNSKGRYLRIPPHYTFNDLVVTNTTNITVLPKIAPEIIKRPVDTTITEFTTDIDPQIFRYQKSASNLTIYKRLKPSYCDICKRQHESVGMYFATFENRVTRHCFQSKKSVVLKTADKKYNCMYDIVMEFNNKSYTYPDIMIVIKDALKQIIAGTSDGSNAAVVLKKGQHEYSVQRLSSFNESQKFFSIMLNDKRITFQQIIQKGFNDMCYDKFVFNPSKNVPKNVFNLFFGFKATPIQNDILAQPILDHIRISWANNNPIIYKYILDWFTAIIQGIKTGTCLVLHSKQGSGKNIITNFIRSKVIGDTYSVDAAISHTLKDFNGKFESKVFTIINEASNTDDNGSNYHATFDKLKDLMTADKLDVQRKFVESFVVDDYNNFLITTNHERPVKVETSDRRFTMIRANDLYIGNRPYFDNLAKYTDKDGEYSDAAANAFMYVLCNNTITSDIRLSLNTGWKEDIIKLCEYVDPVSEFIKDITYPTANQLIDTIYSDYDRYCKKGNIPPLTQILLFKKLVSMKYCGEKQRGRKRIDGIRQDCPFVIINEEFLQKPNDDIVDRANDLNV